MPPRSRGPRLFWVDFLALWITIESLRKQPQPPSQRDFFNVATQKGSHQNLINAWLQNNGVDRIYSTPLTSNSQVTSIIKRLRDSGLVEPSGPYFPTKKGRAIFDQVGQDWRKWPLEVPLRDGELDFHGAQYPPTL
jgi:hypothetical protein